jgi:hypothetical protein
VVLEACVRCGREHSVLVQPAAAGGGTEAALTGRLLTKGWRRSATLEEDEEHGAFVYWALIVRELATFPARWLHVLRRRRRGRP